MSETNLLTLNVQPAAASVGEELSINHREGPVEASSNAGSCRLTAVADFDPAPQLDGYWAGALKPFRAVPRQDCGCKLILRVIEDAAPAGAERIP